MIRAVHVHSDPKFVRRTDLYDRAVFDNAIVFISDGKLSGGQYDGQIQLSTHKHDLERAAAMCSDADLVVLYGLDDAKSYIATRLRQGITVAWRFFGAELYKRDIESYLSERTLALYRTYSLPRILWRWLAQVRFRLDYGVTADAVFAEAIRRTDLFLGLSRREYDHLATQWSDLPRFVQVPLFGSLHASQNRRATDDFVVVGNSGNIWNNHIDVIQLINDSCDAHSPTYIVPFSYGSGRYYLSEVRRQIRSSPAKIKLLEHFLPREAYLDLITTARAAVINSYRQLAMGNISAYLAHGVKVYLNPRNVVYHWLMDLGFRVYTIDDFASDLGRTERLELSLPDKQINAEVVQQLRSQYSGERFVNQMLELTAHRLRLQNA